MSIRLAIAGLGAVAPNMQLPAYRQLGSKLKGGRCDSDVGSGSMPSPISE